MNKYIIAAIIFGITSLSCQSQALSASPVINSDGTVTFTLDAQDADDVYIKGSFIPEKNILKILVGASGKSGKAEMEEEDGVWTFTTDRLPSEFYTYYFEVDDERMLDPNNKNVVRDIADTLNYFVVPGGIGDDYLTRDVPHGKIKKVWYPSELKDMEKRRMSVYLPAEYFVDREKRFPVLYLLHGSGGDEDSWGDCGRAAQILDNLIADGRCQPMIVVMPNGNVDLRAAPGHDPDYPDKKPRALNLNSMVGLIESVFMSDVVNYVDTHYRTLTDKSHRAIAGLSLGGLHTLYISLNNPDKFDYIGLFSAQTTNALNDEWIDGLQKIGDVWRDFKRAFSFTDNWKAGDTISQYSSENLDIYDHLDTKLSKLFNPAPKLYYIAVGRDDFVKKLVDDYRDKLDSFGYKYYYNETDGAHTWENWRKYLVDFLPRIFK